MFDQAKNAGSWFAADESMWWEFVSLTYLTVSWLSHLIFNSVSGNSPQNDELLCDISRPYFISLALHTMPTVRRALCRVLELCAAEMFSIQPLIFYPFVGRIWPQLGWHENDMAGTYGGCKEDTTDSKWMHSTRRRTFQIFSIRLFKAFLWSIIKRIKARYM